MEMQRNVVYVGSKPSIIYAASIHQQAVAGENEIHIKARGKATSRAIDVSQIAINRFVPDFEIPANGVKIGTEEKEFERPKRDNPQEIEKIKMNISTLDILLKRKK